MIMGEAGDEPGPLAEAFADAGPEVPAAPAAGAARPTGVKLHLLAANGHTLATGLDKIAHDRVKLLMEETPWHCHDGAHGAGHDDEEALNARS
jgi:hypothetical protein